MVLSLSDIKVGEYYIVDPDGKIHSPAEYKTSDKAFMSLIRKEVFKEAVEYKASPHVKFLKKLKIADNEPYSDAGHLTYLPKGALMLDLLMDYSLKVVLDLGAVPVHTSIMYDLNLPSIKEHAKLFGQRMYRVKPGKREFILRYAACFGQFAMLRRYYLSKKDLPLKVFEMADSYRYEQKGEIRGLARVRRFYMPDLHVITKDLKEAMGEFKEIYRVIFSEARSLGWEYYSLYNVTFDFIKSDWDFIVDLVRMEGKPILLYIVAPGKYYWIINIEFHYIDSLGKPLETATVQIDIGNSKRFDIKYFDEEGGKNYPIIIHTAIHGSIERLLFEFLEEAAKMVDKGMKPMLPIWLSPTQVRIVPVSERNLTYSERVQKALESSGFRADIDDREITVSRKIKDAESEWIPYIVVIGDKEESENLLSVRIRNGGIREYRLEEFIKELREKTREYPKRPLYYSKYVSRRPVFI